MRGTRPKPTKIKEMLGNPGKRPLNEREPLPIPGIPACPKWLTGIARQEWEEITPQLDRMGVLYRTDGKALAAYCVCYARWRQAELRVAKEGQVVEEPVLARIGTTDNLTVVGHRLKRHPATIIAKEMAHEMRAFLIEFGMTPSARTRIEVDPTKKLPETSRAESYFEADFGPENSLLN
jgi:P27 family predicted phage terminase small subunit